MAQTVQPVLTNPLILYQSGMLSAYAERLIHGFTGKPLTLGGTIVPADEVRANRLALCSHAGLNAARLTLPRQTHSRCFRTNDTPFDGEADAVILTESGIPAMVQVADCVPVILYAPDRHVGAVVHAGWRGTAQAITRLVAETLLREYNVVASDMRAAIGPCICGCCYEVSQEVSDSVAQSIPDADRALYERKQNNGKPYIDLQQVNALQLQDLGVRHIDILDACTRCRADELWSHRRGEGGRQVAYLQLLARNV